MATSTTKTATCFVRFQGYDWRNELTITSPTGRSVTVYCNGLWRSMSEDFLAFVNRFQNAHGDDYRWGSWATVEVPYAIMAEAKALSK